MTALQPTGNRLHGPAKGYIAARLQDPDTVGVSVMVSYITSDGVALLAKDLKKFTDRHPGKLRIIASSHGGITEPSALKTLLDLGAEVRVSYDTSSTRFHGKAWVFERDGTAPLVHVGSSNWTPAGLETGEELNVLVPDANSAMLKYFDDAWAILHGSEFLDESTYVRHDEMADLITSVQTSSSSDILKPYQRALLNTVTQKRQSQASAGEPLKSLLVAATGTGKTVISSVDFKELRDDGKVKSILYVAHRKEILEQAIDTYRFVLNNANFGQLRPDCLGQAKHAFLSVQWLVNHLAELDSERFDYIVIDEAHHACAPIYAKVLGHFLPKYLMGLTATPERGDGKSILPHFGGQISAELRLWDAISDGYLAPFKYYAVDDDTDLRNLKLSRGEYRPGDLEKVYLQNDNWLAAVYAAFVDKTKGVAGRKVLGFCPSVKVSERVAEYFAERGVVARHLDGGTPQNVRDDLLKNFKNGSIEALFSVDLLNEGIDVPDVNVVLLLRPTASATVFMQQIGRGLRRKDGNAHCTIVDYVGNNNEEFNLATKFSYIIPAARARLTEVPNGDRFEVELNGCLITLTSNIAAKVLASLRKQLTPENLGHDLKHLGESRKSSPSLTEFLEAVGVDLSRFYAATTFTDVQRYAGGSAESEDTELDLVIRRNLKLLVSEHKRGAPMFEPSLRFLAGGTLKSGEEGYVDALCRVLFSGENATKAGTAPADRRQQLQDSVFKNELTGLLAALAAV